MILNIGQARTQLQAAIRGKIGDPQDDPVAAARVVLSGSKLAQKISTQTGNEGYFMFSRIPPGTYTLEVNYEGFNKLVQRGISVQEHTITGLDLKMDIQEDSRSLKLRALSLEYIADQPDISTVTEPAQLSRRLAEAIDGLRLDRALFNPPPVAKVGRSEIVEFGIYQNLKETILRRLREGRSGLLAEGTISIALIADLQVAGCLVLPKSLPRQEINGARYVGWRWQILPQASGRGLVRLDLRVAVDCNGQGRGEKSLLLLDREMVIRDSLWLSWRHRVRAACRREDQPGHPDR
jgi:hypothetical protein